MNVAQRVAPEVDRLVIGLNRRAGAVHGARLRELAHERDLDSLDMLPHFEDFLFTGTLTRDVAIQRLRYRSPESVLARLDELETKGLIRAGPTGFAAMPALRPLLDALLEARADLATELWRDHDDDVATITRLAGVVADAATTEHPVAVAHRELPVPADPYLRLEHRLFTLRYIRQHDHAAAWLARSLTAPQMVVLTALWGGDEVPDDAAAVEQLNGLGYVDGDPPRLTATGRQLRDAVEDDTNTRNQRSFDVLDDPAAADLLSALRRLPGTVI